LRPRRVALDLLTDQRQDRRRRGPFEVTLERLDVGRLPALDVLDHDETPLDREQPHRVAGRDDVIAAGFVRGEDLRCGVADAVTQAAQGTRHLRAIRARDQVGRGELCHRRQA